MEHADRGKTNQNALSGPAHSRQTGEELPTGLVIVPDLNQKSQAQSGAEKEKSHSDRSPQGRLDEAVGLIEAIGIKHPEAHIVPVRKPVPATLFGKGKVEELKALIKIGHVGLVFVDFALSPIQQRNLETAWQTKVLDRTGLILEIFGARAQTNEGRLQVELAHLTYQKSRLVRSWTHLERQRGGFGFLGGPGETQIEADRRQIQERIKRIEKQLAKVRNMRGVHRSKRQRVPHPVIALVGYTNAGKSTLFNALTGETLFAKDLLFATLDPTLRRINLPHGDEAILSDTVGFISDLPTGLVAAFRATLEEVNEADIIVHVRDVASADFKAQAIDVEAVLSEMGIEPSDDRILEVWNKIDQLGEDERGAIKRRAEESGAVPVSAISGEGLEGLLAVLEERLALGRPVLSVSVPPTRARELAWLYDNAEVLSRSDDTETGICLLQIRLPDRRLDAFHNWAEEAGLEVMKSAA